jgi:serine acetyltransferase
MPGSHWSVKFTVTVSDPDAVPHAAAVIADAVRAWQYNRVESNGSNISVHVRVAHATSEDDARKAARYLSGHIRCVLQAEEHPEHSIVMTELQKWKT